MEMCGGKSIFMTLHPLDPGILVAGDICVQHINFSAAAQII
tara:strand:+ start:74 stop:196 length:123 start_codon:yes stop_codon:yes gene_type:complete